MDREDKRRLMIKLMNVESNLRNADEFIENNTLDNEAGTYDELIAISIELADMANKVSDLTERARALEED